MIHPDADGDGFPDGGGTAYRINERFFDENSEQVDRQNGGQNDYNIYVES